MKYKMIFMKSVQIYTKCTLPHNLFYNLPVIVLMKHKLIL